MVNILCWMWRSCTNAYVNNICTLLAGTPHTKETALVSQNQSIFIQHVRWWQEAGKAFIPHKVKSRLLPSLHPVPSVQVPNFFLPGLWGKCCCSLTANKSSKGKSFHPISTFLQPCGWQNITSEDNSQHPQKANNAIYYSYKHPSNNVITKEKKCLCCVVLQWVSDMAAVHSEQECPLARSGQVIVSINPNLHPQ